jgi:anti-sigma factor RsiW
MHGFIDGELDLMSSIEIEEHLEDCPSCSRSHQNQQALRSALRDDALYFKAPVGLQKQVRRAVRARGEGAGFVRPSSRWLAAAASLAIVAIFVAREGFLQTRRFAGDLVAREIVSNHVRSLMANHLTDVTSADSHSVKPWFQGKLDFAPPVRDLAANGFPLAGGRLDYVHGRAVAVLVYRARAHYINVYIWPSGNDSGSSDEMIVRQGYNAIHWNRAGMSHWAVSDLNAGELQKFVRALQSP